MKKIALLILILGAGVAFSACTQQIQDFFARNQDDVNEQIDQYTQSTSGSGSSTTGTQELPAQGQLPYDDEEETIQKGYTLVEVSKHSTKDDCWIAIEGEVYDVTGFIASGNHPGGAAIIQGCGKDATAMFNNRPNGSGAHSETARSFLPNFYIGEFIN